MYILHLLFFHLEAKVIRERMKYVPKPRPDQEKHMLNHHLINSNSVASHCHPNDLPAWIVTNHDLCGWNDYSNNCSVPPCLFVMLTWPEELRRRGRKRSFTRFTIAVITNALQFSAEVFDCGSLHIYFLNIIVLYWIFWGSFKILSTHD